MFTTRSRIRESDEGFAIIHDTTMKLYLSTVRPEQIEKEDKNEQKTTTESLNNMSIVCISVE